MSCPHPTRAELFGSRCLFHRKVRLCSWLFSWAGRLWAVGQLMSCIKSFMDCFVKVVCPVQFFLSTSHPCDITVLNCQFRFCMISAGYCILLLSFNQMGISFVCPLQGLRPRAVTCQTMPSQQAPLRWMPKDFFVLWSCRGLCSWRALLV